jgi:hypothetical protein
MNDQQLDKFLKEGKKQSEGFFSQMNADAVRKAVAYKVSEPEFGAKSVKKKALRWPLGLKIGMAAAVGLAACLTVFCFAYTPKQAETKPVTGPVAEQAVFLDNSDKNYLVSYMPVNVPKYPEPGLMTILWGMGGSSGKADPEMLYSSLFEKCDEPYPASTIGFLGTDSKYILLSSGDSHKSYLHYRLIGFSEGAIKTFWSEDYVPNGNLDLMGGAVIEQRNAVYHQQAESEAARVSYIIPYKTDELGGLYLPVEKLQLHVGEQMLLVGDEGDDLKIRSKEGIVKEIDENGRVTAPGRGRVLQAYDRGDDVVSISEDGGGSMKYILVNIVE